MRTCLRLKNFLNDFNWGWVSLMIMSSLLTLSVSSESFSQSNLKKNFPVDGYTSYQVKFWEKVFHDFPSTTMIIHDSENVNKILDIINFKKWAKKRNIKKVPNYEQRDLVSTRYLVRYKTAVRNFSKHGSKARTMGPFERRLFDTYKKSPHLLSKLYKGEIKLRVQSGLADEFLKAAHRAQKYLPYMEKTFKDFNLPVILTRLVFVESMFKVEANSSVGARGMWQFMERTAKRNSLKVSSEYDERVSPYKATIGAAILLEKNYNELKSWPLAITAYNHGRDGMRNATKQLGTKNMGVISKNYKSKTFGFASRNFYAEFYAAVIVYNRLKNDDRINKKKHLPLLVGSINLKNSTSIFQLSKITNISASILRKLNLCLNADYFKSGYNKKLPKNYKIFLPKKAVKKFQ